MADDGSETRPSDHAAAASGTPAPASGGSASPASGAALPAASPVSRMRSAVSGWSRGRKTLAIGSVAIGGALVAVGMLTSGSASGPGYNAPVTVYADSIQDSDEGPVASGERPPAERTEDGDASGTRDPEVDESVEQDAIAPPSADASGTTSPGDPGAANPGGTDPGTAPTIPGTAPTTPSAPPAPPPAPTDPAPPSTPPSPSTPPAPAAAPLGFAGLHKNYVAGVLGIQVLSSYTLTVTGQPGATAAVTYGSTDAGTVRFDAAGRATTTLGASLIDLGLSDPIIRVAYSDGTVGTAIEARRNTL